MKKQLKINKEIRKSGVKYMEGQVLSIEFDSNNQPIDRFWRFRLKDAAIDNCVEVVEKDVEKKTKIKQDKV